MNELIMIRTIKLVVLATALIVVLRVDTARLAMLVTVGIVGIGIAAHLNMIRLELRDLPGKVDALAAKL